MPMRHDKPCGNGVSNVQSMKHIPSICRIVNIVLAVVEDFNKGRSKLGSFLKAVGKLFLTFVLCSYLLVLRSTES